MLQPFDFLRHTSAVLYVLAIAVFFEVYQHAVKTVSKANDAKAAGVEVDVNLPDSYPVVSFYMMIAAGVVGLVLFLIVQSYDHPHMLDPGAWSYIGLIAMVFCSFGYAILVCMFPHGFLPSVIFLGSTVGLLIVCWPFLFKRPKV